MSDSKLNKKVYIEDEESYDSKNILISISLLKLPVYYAWNATQSYWCYGIVLISGEERNDRAENFFETYGYLFFLYSSIEIIILMVSFYVLAFIYKYFLIKLV